MKFAFDVKGTIEGHKGAVIVEALKKLQALGHECVVWSNLYSYTVDAVKKHGLTAETMSKRSKNEMREYEMDLFDVAIEDDRSQSYLGAKNFVFVDEITNNSDALVRYILKKAGAPQTEEQS